MADNINIKAILDTSGVDTSLRGLKKELSDLEGLLGSNLIGEKDKRAVLKRVGEVRAGINQMESDIRGVGLAAGSAFGEMLQYTTPVVAGLTAAGAAAQLFGVENEKLNKILQETTRITIALSAFQQIAENNTIKALVTRRTEQLKNLVVSKLTFKQTVQQSVANQAEATTKGLTTIATKLATKAQLTWNAAIAANPIGAIIVAVALLAAGIYALTKILGNNTKELEKQKVALDGTTFATIEARDKYNDLQFTLKELDLEYKSIVGSLSAFERELANLDLEIEKQITKIQNEYIDALEELEKKHNGVWRRMGNFIIETLDNTGILALQRIKKQSDEQISLYEESQNKQTDVLTVGEQRRLNIIVRNNLNVIKQTEELERRLTQLKQNSLDQRNLIERRQLLTDISNLRGSLKEIVKAYDDTGKDIDEIINGISQKLEELNDESYNLTYLDETQKQIFEIKKEQKKFNEEADKSIQNLIEQNNNRQELIDKAENELDLLREKQYLLVNERESLRSVLNIGLQRREQIEQETDQIELSIDKNVQLFSERLKLVDKEKVAQAGLITNGEILLDTSKKQIDAQQLLLQENQLQSDEISLQSSLYEQLQGFKREQFEVEQNIFSIQNSITESVDKNNEVSAELSVTTAKIAHWTSLTNEQLEEQREELESGKEVYDGIVKKTIERLKAEKAINEFLDLTYLKTREFLNQDISSLRKKQIEGEIEAEKEKADIIQGQRKDALRNYYNSLIDIANTTDNPELAGILTLQMTQELEEVDQLFKDKWRSLTVDTVNIMADIAAIGTDAFMEIFNRSIENKFDQLNERLMNKVSQQKDTLDKLKENDLIDEEEYNARLLKIEEESLKESNRLKYEQAKAEKAAALIQIAIDTAIGAAKAFAQGGGLFGPGLAGLVLFQGAMSAALVASQPLPQYEMGGLVKGLPHSQGGVPVELEGNEYVIRKEIVQQPGVLPLLETINQTPSSKRPQFNNDDNFITELKETILGITQIPVTNLESEYTRVQRRVNSIETRSRF